MSTQIFVNLPVADLPRSKVFFEALGWHFNPQFTNEQGACLVISDTIHVMLLTNEFFQTFIPGKTIGDARKQIETITCLSADSAGEVNRLVDAAVAAGATIPREPQDMGFMYSRSFDDLDGHQWEVVHMDMSKVPEQL
ncbi:VOC family protein [Pseudoxanthomonas indica]|uniref:VOC domain-containing protein n=1 Tax=Pseudoxanthomonas indica TaxID=428993 RepID=A0A1T5LA25_9GAMM|nr:VOC family protein [Pseudoxanthomonas indica]GGD32228.1 extradiol dioxygenase [Pseudoxanthomonas indica]SKC72545.1 hypothetical protein SAMN06296058_2150 [Pseudoxanthomonas indica]